MNQVDSRESLEELFEALISPIILLSTDISLKINLQGTPGKPSKSSLKVPFKLLPQGSGFMFVDGKV
jgi:hypothetical protein